MYEIGDIVYIRGVVSGYYAQITANNNWNKTGYEVVILSATNLKAAIGARFEILGSRITQKISKEELLVLQIIEEINIKW